MHFAPLLILAQGNASDSSFLGWMLKALATTSSLFVVLSAVFLFYGACLLVYRNRPRSSLACYLVLLPIPLLISVCGWMYGTIASIATILFASSPGSTIASQGIAQGLATSLISVLFAIAVSLPTYVVLAYGLIAQDFQTPIGDSAMKPVAVEPTLSSKGVAPIPAN